MTGFNASKNYLIYKHPEITRDHYSAPVETILMENEWGVL